MAVGQMGSIIGIQHAATTLRLRIYNPVLQSADLP